MTCDNEYSGLSDPRASPVHMTPTGSPAEVGLFLPDIGPESVSGVLGGTPAFAQRLALSASSTHHPSSSYFCCLLSSCRSWSPCDSHSLGPHPKLSSHLSFCINRILELTQNVTSQVSSGSGGSHPCAFIDGSFPLFVWITTDHRLRLLRPPFPQSSFSSLPASFISCPLPLGLVNGHPLGLHSSELFSSLNLPVCVLLPH